MNERPTRRFSQAIAEGEGISVVAHVATPADSEVATGAGADALIVQGDVAAHRNVSDLPLLCRDLTNEGADAYVVHASTDDDELEQRYFRVVDEGFECVVEVTDEEELERALELLDPEILLLAARDDDGEKLDHVLELLPDVPAGKLVIADAATTHGDEVAGLERVGVDAVIVAARDVATLVGDEPPSV